ncbi:hypothetical protein FCM35_KLT17995 [Carex littledalei]|uniref:Uncharacterized protein n=1 Tax=Carex littledalei TaxID=544730 RepID=A0A833VVV1_9POAL|nr:hypothetical protein FCM35_KLT17995 [Carex littledalei]
MAVMGLHNQKASNVWEDTWLMRLFLFYEAFMSKETPTLQSLTDQFGYYKHLKNPKF